MSSIDQKEYLKKYLSGKDGKDKKKKGKKKKTKAIGSRVKIIDDDLDNHIFNEAAKEDLMAANEDAPQIVGVIDERPLELRMDDFKSDSVWKTFSIGGGGNKSSGSESPLRSGKGEDCSPPRRQNRQSSTSPRQRQSGGDYSPPRKRKDDDASPPRKRRTHNNDVDVSPPRRNRRDNDASPPRKRNLESERRGNYDDNSSYKKRRDVDYSPARRDRLVENNSPRIIKVEDDNSPVRKNRIADDNSPPRKGRRVSPARKYNKDSTLPRKQQNEVDSKRRDFEENSKINSPEQSKHSERGNSPTSNSHTVDSNKKRDDRQKKSRWGEPSSSTSDKLSKTLDGKAAGLQNAKDLVKETQAFKKREDDLFKNMAVEISGVNAGTIMRDRKTGRVRDLEKEAEQKKEKNKEQALVKEKYDKWGKGTKQVEEYNEKLQQDVYEMTKPLARYADDEDLERYLREQERDGDPMLAYIRKKKKKVAVESGKPLKPQYEGEFMPNRFGIRPGHKWDGVDRSNGYEKRWFEVINAKQAEREEIYKWSTEDM